MIFENYEDTDSYVIEIFECEWTRVASLSKTFCARKVKPIVQCTVQEGERSK